MSTAAPATTKKAAAKKVAGYERNQPTVYTQSVFNPNDISPEFYQHFAKDDSFAKKISPNFEKLDAYKKESGEVYDRIKWQYKKDEHEAGFGPGMDDLARIILDNKSTVKFNKRLTTQNGALYWVQQKNEGKPQREHWSVAVYDLNQDGYPEVLVLDARKDIRYINGFHVGKKNMQVVKAHQEWIDKRYGNPSQIAEKRRKAEIAPGELGMQYWMDTQATSLNKDNPLGPLLMSSELKATGYKTRPMNPCNMFLKFVVKDLYDALYKSLIEATYGENTPRSKAIRRLASIIPINAELYNRYVANPVYKQLRQSGMSEKAMKKKEPGKLQSKFSQKCCETVAQVADNGDSIGEIQEYITNKFNDAVTMIAEGVGKLEPKRHIDHRKGITEMTTDNMSRWFETAA